MAAILPAPVAINSKHLATVQASEIIDRFALYPVKVRIPPDISALITAEAPFLLLGNLMNLSAAVLAPSCLAAAWCKRFDHRIPVDVMSATERLYCVQRYAERLGNLMNSARLDDGLEFISGFVSIANGMDGKSPCQTLFQKTFDALRLRNR